MCVYLCYSLEMLSVFIPKERSLVWLAERTTGKLARVRDPRVKATGTSHSDMTSTASRGASKP